MIRSSDWPSASACVKPNMRSAAGFHRTMAPPASVATMASPTASTSWPRSMAAGTACSVNEPSDCLRVAQGRDVVRAVAQLDQDLVGVLAQQRRALDLDLHVREL